METKTKKAVAKTDEKTTAVTGPTSIQQMMMQAAGAGNEGITAQELAIPFLALLQDLSPQTKKRDENYVEGAEAGMFFETVSQSLWKGDEGVLIIPCHRRKMVNEWRKRKLGGGFIASHPDMATAIAECQDPENHDLVDTHQHAVLVRHPNGTWSEAIYPMKSTALKASRQLNSLVTGKVGRFIDEQGKEQTYELPRFYAIWRLKSAEKTNDQGTFFVPKAPEHEIDLEALGEEGERLFERAFKFYQQCQSGEASIDYRRLDPDADVGEEATEDEDGDQPKF